MSKENALKFLAKASEDQGLQKKISAAGANGWADVANGAGFSCTSEELIEASQTLVNQARESGELSDTDLSAVVGGALSSTSFKLSYSGLSFNLGSLGNLSGFKDVMAW